MGSIKEYFTSLGSGVASLVKGMTVTGKEFVTPKITERYPENRETHHPAPRFRAILQFVYDDEGNHKCIACGTCERVCPNGTIAITTKDIPALTPTGKKKVLDKYTYDLGSCTFCQLCVTNCPTHAIEFTNNFEQAVFTRSKLIKTLNYLPEKEQPAPTPEQIAEYKAKMLEAAKAKAAAAAAAKAKAAEAAKSAEAPANLVQPAAPKPTQNEK